MDWNLKTDEEFGSLKLFKIEIQKGRQKNSPVLQNWFPQRKGQVENSEILENSEIFSEIFKSKFSLLTMGQNRKLGNKKTRNYI